MLDTPRRPLACTFALLALCLVAPAGSAAAQQTAALNLGWPSTLQGSVSFATTSSRSLDGQSEDLAVAGSYDISAASVGQGLVVRFDNIETEVENSGSGPQAMIQRYLATAMRLTPSYQVSQAGTSARIAEPVAFRASLRDDMAGAYRDFPAPTRAWILDTMTAAFTQQPLQFRWQARLDDWLDGARVAGDTKVITYRDSIPALGDKELAMRATVLVKGPAACGDQAGPERCLELEIRSQSDSQAAGEGLRQETLVRLISAPNRLQPYVMDSIRRTTASFADAGVSQAITGLETRRMVFSY